MKVTDSHYQIAIIKFTVIKFTVIKSTIYTITN